MFQKIETSLDKKNRSKKPPGSAGRNKFEEPSSPFLPPPIVAWRDALKNVVVRPEPDNSINHHDRGYVFPDPGLFFGISTPEGQAKFLYNWLKYRPALIYRLMHTGHNLNAKPLSSQIWRSMLHMPIDGLPLSPHPHQTSPTLAVPALSAPLSSTQNGSGPTLSRNSSGPERTKSAKRLEVIQSLLQNCLNLDGVQINDNPTNEIFWQDRQLSAGELPEQLVAQEILWELFELNFRFEFMALDSRMDTAAAVPTDHVYRDDLLLRCFPGNISGSILITWKEFAHQGLEASRWQDRAPSIVAVKNIVRMWPGFDQVKEGCSEVDLDKDVEAYLESEIDAMELAIATFYTQTFYNTFGRAAVIPRRLAPKSEQPAAE